MSSAADQTIDELLERYLGLVDQYTTLREDLARAQQAMFHSLARANFTSDRGVRYGQDDFDERMQASRRLTITHSQVGGVGGIDAVGTAPTYTIAKDTLATETAAATEKDDDSNDDNVAAASQAEKKQQQKTKAAAADKGNPLRWFGVLVPQALRDAQGHAVRAVEDLIPRVVSVEAEMAAVEIEVRRARKKRAKAAAAAAAHRNKTQQDRTGTAVSASS